MNDEPSVCEIPAAFPLTLFAAGLAAAPLLVDPRAAIYAFLCCAALVIVSTLPKRPALLFLSCALGIFTAVERLTDVQAGRRTLEALADDRFVQLEAPLVREWRPSQHEGSMLRAPSFRIVGPVQEEFGETLLIFIPSEPPPLGEERMIRAEGFLRISEKGRYAIHVKSPRLISYGGRLPWWDPALWNRHLSQKLALHASRNPRAVALVQAVALGRSEHLPDDARQDYLRGGIYHLLVFSGMQIAVAAAALTLLLRLCGAATVADWMLLLLSVLASRFAGDEPSVARASWMIGLFAVSRLLRRPTSIENLLFVSAMIRLVLRPEELTDPGFGLTYGATAGLILVGKPLAARAKNRLLRALAYSVGAELATTSLTLFFFNHYVIGGSILTLLVGPLITCMLAVSAAALAALALYPPALPPLLSLVGLLDSLTSTAARFFGVDLGLCGLAAAPRSAVLVFAFFSFLSLVSLSRRRFIALRITLLLVPAVISVWTAARDSSVPHPQVELLDVGQGDAILLRNGNGAILVDSGGRLGDERFGRNVLLPILLDRGISKLDAVALSHPDPDHCGGMAAVIEHLEVRELWLSGRHIDHPCTNELIDWAERKQTLVLFIDSVPILRRSGIELRPIITRLRFKRSPVNNSSVVYGVSLGGRTLLLTGDIEKDAERLLSDEESSRIAVDILKVAHHGSKTSSTPSFLAAVDPRIALISCGLNNRFGHPHPDVLSRLLGTSRVVASTHRSGTLKVRIVEGRIYLSREIDTPR